MHRNFPTPGREVAQLLIMRHAIAFECDHHRWHGDGQTPLSPAEIRRSWKAAAGLKEFIKAPDRLPRGPPFRARQTVEIRMDVAAWPQAEEAPKVVTSKSREQRSNKPTR
jgi:phosphohistidine phosphatase SixA